MKLFTELEEAIKQAYLEGVTLEEAEKLAAKFLYGQLQASTELKKHDLDARMRKTGVKAIRATIYSDIVDKSEKKPTEAAIESEIVRNEIVQSEQDKLDTAESTRDELERYYNIFREAHIHFRGIAKGRFE